MALKVPNVGELYLLEVIRSHWNGVQQPVLHLYKSDTVPANGDTLATYTDCDFSGYSPVSLPTWGAAFTESGKAKTVHAAQQFDHDGGATANDVYGYMVESGTGTLLFAERFPSAPVVMNSVGDVAFVTPTFTLSTEN